MSSRPRPRRSLAGAAVVGVAAIVALTIAGTRGNAPALSDVASSSESPAPVESSPTPTASPTVDPSPSPTEAPDPYGALRERLLAVLADPELAVDHGLVAIAVRDRDGRVVLDQAADVPVLPASTQKLVTAAAALQVLGAEHRFVTEAVATGPVEADGTLRGDLVLVGDGDPLLATPGYGRYVYPARPRTPLEELAVRLRTGGLRRVSGHVVADRGRYAGAMTASGWKQSYFWDLDARHVTELTVDAGLVVELRLPEDGAPTPEITSATVADGPTAAPTERGLLLEQVPDDIDPDVQLQLSPDPRLQAARQFQRLLDLRGVSARPEVALGGAPADGIVLGAVRSAPLSSILRHTVQRSDNQVADSLFRELGVTVARDGTWEGGAMATRAALGTLGLPWNGVVLADGSGLSRDNRLTAAFLADLDVVMASSPFGETWASLMAVSGREGTLRHRLRDTAAEGRLLGKTGTLDDVAAVAGVVTGSGRARFHLAVVGNDVRGADREVVRRIVDELTLVLVAELDGDVPAVAP